MPANRVAITGLGIVSPLGIGAEATETALRDGRDCIAPVTAFDTSKCRCSTAGHVADTDLPVAPDRRTRRLHRTSHMMREAMRQALEDAQGFSPQMAVIGTTSGGMTYGEAFFRSLGTRDSRSQRAAWVANYMPQKPVLDALDEYAFHDIPIQIIANACASGSNAIGCAWHLIRSGKAQRVLAGGYDAISEMVFVGFDSLQASTAEKCRPFDRDRTGLVLGEGAALLALETEESARENSRKILGYMSGYGISTDNHHLTQPHPSGDGPFQAMLNAIQSANCRASEIDYVNAHGTATAFNDATEGIAIDRIFQRAIPISSTKSMMGHSLGAAGAIEAAVTLIAMQAGFYPPNINLRQPDPERLFEVVTVARPSAIRRALSNSFGFGGTNATLLLEAA